VIVEADKAASGGPVVAGGGAKPQRGFVIEDTGAQPVKQEGGCCGGS